MSTELRFLLAIALMLGVLIGTNVLFPPVVEEAPASAQPATPDGEAAGNPDGGTPVPTAGAAAGGEDSAGGDTIAVPEEEVAPAPAVPEKEVLVESPLARYTFSSYGARLTRAELPGFRSMREEGAVQLVPEGTSALGHRLAIGSDTVDLRGVPFEVEPAEGLTLTEDGGPGTLRFIHRAPSGLVVELAYTFHPDAYLVEMEGRVASGGQRPLVVTDMGDGLAFSEADSAAEATMMAYVVNHLHDGIDSTPLEDVSDPRVVDGPLLWAAFKSKFFVMAVLSGHSGEEDDYLGGILMEPAPAEHRARLAVTQAVGNDGTFDYQIFTGPQEYARLSALGDDLEEVNPYGWRFIRPVLRPIVGVIMFCLTFLHNTLSIGYGWVLILFGVLMRVLLWPLYMKSMRAQMTQMRVQPLLKEIQTKHKDNPERLQKEMMKLYKEHGFNPLAGCLPMLLPWPVLIALFFVFQNTIELRGVSFLWLPDLSAADPYYILPVFLALSMFLLQFISLRSMEQTNPQMKMMMWIMPLFLGFLFMNFASGLNLYYATANIATIPQQVIVARERRKVTPIKVGGEEDGSG